MLKLFVPLSVFNKNLPTALTVEKLKAAYRPSVSELDALKASLQHRAFRGE